MRPVTKVDPDTFDPEYPYYTDGSLDTDQDFNANSAISRAFTGDTDDGHTMTVREMMQAILNWDHRNVDPFHNNAEPAAEAAMAAHAQGKFWQMHDKLFQNQTALDQANLDKYAQETGLNMAKYKADVEAKKYKATIEAETKEGQAVGVNGTPAVFINGRKISGAYPFETFKKIADEELAKKTGKKKG